MHGAPAGWRRGQLRLHVLVCGLQPAAGCARALLSLCHPRPLCDIACRTRLAGRSKNSTACPQEAKRGSDKHRHCLLSATGRTTVNSQQQNNNAADHGTDGIRAMRAQQRSRPGPLPAAMPDDLGASGTLAVKPTFCSTTSSPRFSSKPTAARASLFQPLHLFGGSRLPCNTLVLAFAIAVPVYGR